MVGFRESAASKTGERLPLENGQARGNGAEN